MGVPVEKYNVGNKNKLDGNKWKEVISIQKKHKSKNVEQKRIKIKLFKMYIKGAVSKTFI